MPKEKKPEEIKAGCPAWMMTFGDCMSLLLTFFVMIISFTTFDDIKVDQMLGSFSRSLGLLTTDRAAIFEKESRSTLQGQEVGNKSDPDDPNLLVLGYKKEDMEKEKSIVMIKAIREKIDGRGLYDMIDIKPLIHGVSIRIQNAVMFEEGSAVFKDGVTEILAFFYDLINHLPNDIIIEGHTSRVSFVSDRYSSNWDLSSARAAAVVNYYVSRGIAPERFGVRPVADTKPLVLPAENQLNSRAEIFIKGLMLGDLPEYERQEKK